MDVEVQLSQLFPTMLGVIVKIYPFFWLPQSSHIIGKETPLQSCGSEANHITLIGKVHPAQRDINLPGQISPCMAQSDYPC